MPGSPHRAIKLTGVVAIDGKALRGAYERGKSTTPLHMVNVFATEARMALASRKAPGRNEAKGALEVLRMLSLEGCIVTGDAARVGVPALSPSIQGINADVQADVVVAG